MWDTSSGQPTPDSPHSRLRGDGPRRAGANTPCGLFAQVDGPVIKITNRITGTTSEIKHGHQDVQYVELNSTGSRLLSTGPKEPIKVWDTATGRVLYTSTSRPLGVPTLELYRQMLSPDGRLLVQQGGSIPAKPADLLMRFPVVVWDIEHDRELAVIWTGSNLAFSNRFSPDGRFLATLDGRVIRVWDLTQNREMFVFRGHDKLVLDIEFSPDGRWLVSVASDNTVRVWDVTPFDE